MFGNIYGDGDQYRCNSTCRQLRARYLYHDRDGFGGCRCPNKACAKALHG